MPSFHRLHRLATSRIPRPDRLAVLALGLVAALAWSSARADDYDEVDRLLRARNPSAALAKIDQALTERPRDPQLRFMRTVALSDAGRTAEALEALQRLTQDYPELPEPHNNLAVLQAASGDLDRARSSLETALRLNPDYAVAMDNLGDVQARLALRSWSQAQQLDASLRSRVAAKATRVREALDPPAAPRAGALRPAGALAAPVGGALVAPSGTTGSASPANPAAPAASRP